MKQKRVVGGGYYGFLICCLIGFGGEEGFIRLIGVGGGMAVVTAAQLYLAVIEEERKKAFPHQDFIFSGQLLLLNINL